LRLTSIAPGADAVGDRGDSNPTADKFCDNQYGIRERGDIGSAFGNAQ
jgi:hypothetical protein